MLYLNNQEVISSRANACVLIYYEFNALLYNFEVWRQTARFNVPENISPFLPVLTNIIIFYINQQMLQYSSNY